MKKGKTMKQKAVKTRLYIRHNGNGDTFLIPEYDLALFELATKGEETYADAEVIKEAFKDYLLDDYYNLVITSYEIGG